MRQATQYLLSGRTLSDRQVCPGWIFLLISFTSVSGAHFPREHFQYARCKDLILVQGLPKNHRGAQI